MYKENKKIEIVILNNNISDVPTICVGWDVESIPNEEELQERYSEHNIYCNDRKNRYEITKHGIPFKMEEAEEIKNFLIELWKAFNEKN